MQIKKRKGKMGVKVKASVRERCFTTSKGKVKRWGTKT